MSPAESTLRTSATMIAGALAAELVVYLGVLLAYSIPTGQPAQQINGCGPTAVGSVPRGWCDDARAQRTLSVSTVLPFPQGRLACRGAFPIHNNNQGEKDDLPNPQ